MLLEEYDNSSPVFEPTTFRKPIKNFPKTCISIFSKVLIDELVQNFQGKEIGLISDLAQIKIYEIEVEGERIAVYQSPVGAPACVIYFEEMIAMGIKNLILAGSCGCLSEEIQDYSIVIPTAAFRDEGTSYHYLPPQDEIKLNEKCQNLIEKTIKKLDISYHKGKTWTTDAIYRETSDKLKRRKEGGAITVDMECSAMTAVAKVRNVNFGQIFYAADSLAKEEYDARSLVQTYNLSTDTKIIDIVVNCALAFAKEFN